jgi:MFS family permease
MDSQKTYPGKSRQTNLFYGYRIVAYSYIIAIIVWGGYNSFGVFFDSLLQEFGWSRAVTSGAFSLCTALGGSMAILGGRLTDRFGPRPVMTVCGLLLGAGYILMSRIDAVWQFYLVYGVLIGIGTCGFWVPVLSTVSRWFFRKRGLMLGIVLTGAGIGTIIFPPVGNWLISRYGWRTSFIIIGAVTLVIGMLLSQFMKRDPSWVGQSPDGVKGTSDREDDAGNRGYTLSEAILTPQMWMSIAVCLFFGFAAYTIIVHIVPQALFSGISSASAANILAVVGGVSILGGLSSGAISDRIGIRKSVVIVLAILALALVWLIFSREAWQFYLFAAFFGFAFGSLGVSESILSVWLFGLKSNAIILAVIDFGATIGSAIGPLVAGYIFDVAGSYQIAFILSAAICLIGLLLTLWLKPARTHPPPEAI